MDFEEVREYVPGDDVRKMDWNVTARMQKPHIKVFREEKESTLLLCIDTSASMWFGKEKTKVQLAAEIATIFACLSEKQKDQIGFFAYDTKEVAFVPPRSGTDHLWHILQVINKLELSQERTDTAFALERVMRLPGKRMQVLWFSDFLHLAKSDPVWTKGMRALQGKHQLQLIEVADRLEDSSGDAASFSGLSGSTLWRDSETGRMALGRGSPTKPKQERFVREVSRKLWSAYTDENLVDLFRRYMVQKSSGKKFPKKFEASS